MIEATYLREQKKYTREEISDLLGCGDEVKASSVIRELERCGVLVSAKNLDRSRRDDDSPRFEEADSSDEHSYVVSYVGVVVACGHVLICYPKYLLSKDETIDRPAAEMRQVMRVLERYRNAKERDLRMFDDIADSSGGNDNLLDYYFFLLQDYYDNGLYANDMEIVESNGLGEIVWGRTIDYGVAVMSDDRPIYLDLQTRRKIEDEYDYFRRLHRYVLTRVSKELDEVDLLDMFGLERVDFMDEAEEEFKDVDYILYRLDCELNRQFNSRKQLVLKAMRLFFDRDMKLSDTNYTSSYGTTSFNLVWEDALRGVFDRNGDTDRLKNMIENPFWTKTKNSVSDTFIPDIVCMDGDSFLILDAKYYLPVIWGEKTSGMPGIESISKQYLYQLAFKDFIDKHNLFVENCFLFPTEEDFVGDAGEEGDIRLDILFKYGLKDIKVRFLPASKIFECYLDNEPYPIENLKLDEAKTEKMQRA